MRYLPFRRHVPHWEHPGGTVCLTWHLHRDQPPLRPEERDLVLAVIVRGEGVLGEIVAGVVMDDHAHVLVALRSEATARQAAQTWKSVSSHGLTREFGRTSPVWRAQYFDRWFRDRGSIEACGAYVLENPVRRWPSIQNYRWIIQSSLSPRP